MKQVIKSIQSIPMQNILKATAGFFVGYAGSKFLSEKAGSMYSDKKEIVEFGSSVLITGGVGFGYTKINNQHVKSLVAGALTGSGANTVIKLLKVPQINQMIPESFRSTVNLFGDESNENFENLSGNYAELFDYAKGLETQLQRVTGQQPTLPARATDMGTAIENYASQVDSDQNQDEDDKEIGSDSDPFEHLQGEEDSDPYALLGEDSDPYAHLQGE